MSRRRTGNNYSGARWPYSRRRTLRTDEQDHGRPHYYECKVPDCTRDGHKCYRPGCTDPVHTHPAAPQPGEQEERSDG